MKTSLLFALVIFVFGGFAHAKNAKKEESEHLKFQGLQLKGQFKKPDLTYIYKRKGIRSEKILNIPDGFNDEITQGTHQF